MKTILCIGLGSVGLQWTRRLIAQKNEVLVVDTDEARLREFMDSATNVQIGDCTKPEVLESLGIDAFDTCMIDVGNDFKASLEIASLLKDMGAKHIVARAFDDTHAKFLLRNGADEIICPERDFAARAAYRYSSDRILDCMPLATDSCVCEILPPHDWIGRTLGEIRGDSQQTLTPLGVRANDQTDMACDAHVLCEGERLLVFGSTEALDRFIED